MGNKRRTIGILYQPSNNWIAGAYYIQNIVSALNFYCTKKNAPNIIVLCNSKKDFDDLKNVTQYSRLSCHLINSNPNKLFRLIFRIIKKITGKKITLDKIIVKRIKFIYPSNSSEFIPARGKCLAWIPDFQEKYYPDLFTSEDINFRDTQYRKLISDNTPIVFSSNSAQNDFRTFYPEGQSIKSFVLPFTVVHPYFSNEKIEIIKQKYGITQKYLFCANQFWIHKNHMKLFEAINILRSNGFNLQLVCSGALHDYRTNTYHSDILNFIKKNNLQDSIKILGFIERTEQLCLMKNSYAIVQPSLFEGWSTVVEDAKCLNKFIFLSDLSVHHEQKPVNACFFNPNDEYELAMKIMQTKIIEKKVNYVDNIKLSGKTFLDIINNF